ncbi:hypothetical protein LARV_03496 [Longilinea arvoryzae]|uniref:DUF4345 domain-containing protein n=1 Tax=Longilinea arvoryzae TaxID=360412 RepID=A0A0S7BN20_9CHLR|nr:DUF4345 family protein [Longilinea arvoryzae]GAP15704.1 hypothetical protein LARV_03496 [Longilinea arvoryzae]
MNLLTIFKMIAALGTAATGFLALVRPTAIYGFTGLIAEGPRGISEIRAIFGALFIALGIAPFLFGATAYRVLGLGYLTIALVRLVSIFIDRSTSSSNLISLAIEIVFGIILILR